MNKYFKKFSIMFVMLLAIIGIGIIQNGSVANAATVGQQLTQPEAGWTRYDDTDSRIIHSGTGWTTFSNASCYKGELIYSNYPNNILQFKFYGTKLRIIALRDVDKNANISIAIDNNTYSFSEQGAQLYECLAFEVTNLSNSIHSVSIITPSNTIASRNFTLDAIDIDDTGSLIDPNESISLDKSSIDLTTGDSQQLAATTTPAGAAVTWTSSDPSIATVDSNGKVTGISEGTATITATTADGLTAICTVNVTPKDSEPTDPNGDANLYIELVDGQIKQYTVSSDEINKFTEWYENRDNDHSLSATYKFTKGSYTDYVVQNQIDWFEVR